MPAVQRHIELQPEPVTAANATTTGVIATTGAMAATAGPTGAATAGATAATTVAFPGWAPVAAIAATGEGQLQTVFAALSGRGVRIARKNSEAVTAAVETNESNRQSLTVIPVAI
ncbi:hypothetical protein [Mycolicibacterium wolinskyi]|nr:hypothetical protein [Mycolicibacterium wolinskyi]